MIVLSQLYYQVKSNLLQMIFIVVVVFSYVVGEEDEVSIQQAAEAVVKAMDFTGEVKVRIYRIK
jgi:hypothetical protein